MKKITCPLCHIAMAEVSKIIKSERSQTPKLNDQLKFYDANQYGLYVDQGFPTQRKFVFFECLGCGLTLLFNEDKVK